MLSLVQSARARGSAGEPLVNPFKNLADLDINFYRGDVVLVAAPSGLGKSSFAISLAMRSHASAFYFSADSNAFVQLSRAISIATGRDLEESKRIILDGEVKNVQSYLQSYPLRMDYDASPTLEHISNEVEAYYEVYGHYPDLVVIDNLGDVRRGAEDSLEDLMDYLRDLARKTDSCVLCLHHVNKEYNTGLEPIPMNGIKDQPHRVPSMVLTLFTEPDYGYHEVLFNVSVVKNRNGDSSRDGTKYGSLLFNPKLMSLRDA